MSSPSTEEQAQHNQVEDLRREVAGLGREVAQLRDKEAIRAVLDRYAFLLDTAQWRDISVEVFTADAVDHHSPAAGPSAVPRGRAEIDHFLDTTMSGFAGSQHMMGNSSITVDGDTAHSRTYAACAHWRTGGPQPRASDFTVAVAYDDTWRRTPDGWRISERWVHTFGAGGLLAGTRSADLPRLGSDLYGSRDR